MHKNVEKNLEKLLKAEIQDRTTKGTITWINNERLMRE
jgi:hypothetical protein